MKQIAVATRAPRQTERTVAAVLAAHEHGVGKDCQRDNVVEPLVMGQDFDPADSLSERS